MRGVVLLLAAGGGERLERDGPKAFVEVAGVPIIRRAAEAAASAELVDGLVVVVPEGSEERARRALAGLARPFEVVPGGPTRQGSARRGLEAVDAPAVAVHDAARPLCPPRLFDWCLEWLDGKEAVCVALPVTDTLKEAEDGWIHSMGPPIRRIHRTLDRERIIAVQTPQAFRTEIYRRAHAEAERDDFEGTDDASLVERIDVPVWYTLGDPANMKVTTPHDLDVAEALLR